MKRLLSRADLWYALAVAGAVIYEGATFLAPVGAWPARLWPVIAVILIHQLLTWQHLARKWQRTAETWQRNAALWREVAHNAYFERSQTLAFWERVMCEEHRYDRR